MYVDDKQKRVKLGGYLSFGDGAYLSVLNIFDGIEVWIGD